MSLLGCSEVKTYEVQVENGTDHHFEQLVIKLGDSAKISLEPYQKSEILEMNYTTSWANFFGPGDMHVWYGNSSDSSLNNYSHVGGLIGRDQLSEESLNTVILSEDSADSREFWCRLR